MTALATKAGIAGRALDPTSAPAIEWRGLRKIYHGRNGQPDKEALCGIDLEVPRGSFFGLLGPNGAGKSTAINILAGLVRKTAGEVRVCGIDLDADPRRVRRMIGIVPQELNLDPFFTPREILELQAGLYGVPKAQRRTDAILEALGLADKADAAARSLSGGMRRRLLVAKALVHQPPVVVLDEPTAGVDIELRRSLWRYMQELNREGVTIVLTTHYLEEAEELCDRIAIIDRGRLVACDEKGALLRRLDEKELIATVDPSPCELPDSLRAIGAERDAQGRIRIRFRPSQIRVGTLLDRLRDAGLTIVDLVTREPDLEELFLRLTASGQPQPTAPAGEGGNEAAH